MVCRPGVGSRDRFAGLLITAGSGRWLAVCLCKQQQQQQFSRESMRSIGRRDFFVCDQAVWNSSLYWYTMVYSCEPVICPEAQESTRVACLLPQPQLCMCRVRVPLAAWSPIRQVVVAVCRRCSPPSACASSSNTLHSRLSS